MRVDIRSGWYGILVEGSQGFPDVAYRSALRLVSASHRFGYAFWVIVLSMGTLTH